MSDVNVYEHEIPNGSKLYFAKSAKLKRKIEQKASEILEDEGFSEIVTPFFSYHQHLSVDATNLLRFSDSLNHEISLRADSTVDTVRIVLRRLKANEPKRWFYIQPVFRYPSQEIYQIGAELIGENDILKSINIVAKLFSELEIGACLQLSNMQIPRIICEILNLEIEIFENSWLEKILAQNVPWLSKLALLKDASELDEIVNLEIPNNVDNKTAFFKLLKEPEVLNKSFIYDQYDANIQTNTIKQPGHLGAASIRVKGTKKAVSMAAQCDPRANFVDPKVGAARAVAAAGRKVAMSGAVPLAITDCLNYGNPQNPEVMWQFKELSLIHISEPTRPY
mgnify:FL=1